VFRLDARFGPRAKEVLNADMTEALDHKVYLYAIQATRRGAPHIGYFNRALGAHFYWLREEMRASHRSGHVQGMKAAQGAESG
jgi:hypothetical protein